MVSYFPDRTASNFTPAPVGAHRAVCYRLIDLGTQQREYQGQRSTARQVILAWELADEFMEEDKPFVVSKFYTWSMNEKANLRKDLESWRGAPFEDADLGESGRFKPVKLIGAPCLLNILHDRKQNGDVKVKIASISRLPKTMQPPQPRNETMFFDLDARPFDSTAFNKLSEKVQDMIKLSPEFQAVVAETSGVPARGNSGAPMYDDDVPF